MALTNVNIHGKHQEIHFGKWKTNKFGVLSGIVERHVMGEPQNEPDWALLMPGAAPPAAVPCVGVERNYEVGKTLGIYAYTYDGLIEGDNSFENRIYCTCEGSDQDEPIATHPFFHKLYEEYQGRRDAQGRFSHFAGPKRKSKDGKEEFNPLYGLEAFITFRMVWTRTFVARSLPGWVFNRVDCIDKPRGHGPMQPPTLRGKRNWLKMAPVAQQRENYVQIALRWMASGRNGWNEDVYSEKSAMVQAGGEPPAE